MSKINTGKITGKIRVRIMRPWRGYPVGTIITPPAGLRQILLQTNDQLGHSVAEVVAEDVAGPLDAVGPVVKFVAENSQPNKQNKKQNKHK